MGDVLFDCYLVAKGSMAFELERCGGMNTCRTSPLPAWIPFTSSQSAALSEKKRAARQRKKGKHPRDFSPVVSLGSGVRGQQLRRYVRC